MERAFEHSKAPETLNKREVRIESIIFSDEEDGELEDIDEDEYTISCTFESEDETDERRPNYEDKVLRNFSGHRVHSGLTGELDEACQHSTMPNVSFESTCTFHRRVFTARPHCSQCRALY